MTKLHRLFDEHGQSPWLDNLTRRDLRNGRLAGLVADGIRGVTANPTIFARAIEGSDAYDAEFRRLMAAGCSVTDAYWQLVVDDVTAALDALAPLYRSSRGGDGFVSVEVAPELARDTAGTVEAARELHRRIHRPNLLVKIPATSQGVPAIEAMIAEGRSINVTLIFSLSRYQQVVEAYLAGIERLVADGGDPRRVHSVASFFVSRVDAEVDRRLDAAGNALGLRGRAGVAQAKLAYQAFLGRFQGPRWERLAALGARPQRPLWASTSTKNPAYLDTMYVDNLIGPSTISTLPDSTISAFEDHGRVARTVDEGVADAGNLMARLADAGVDLEEVGLALEDAGVEAFRQSFAHVLATLDAKARSKPDRSERR